MYVHPFGVKLAADLLTKASTGAKFKYLLYVVSYGERHWTEMLNFENEHNAQ